MSYAVKYKTNKGEEEMKKRRVAKLIALSMVAATLLTGVNVQAKEEKVVTAMTSIDLTPELCDPIKSGPDFRLYEMIYDPLVRYGENGEIKPALAESWDISEDGTTYTFHLRKDVKFSDGTEFNADNVMWNYNRWVEQDVIGNFSAKLENVTKVDDYTVEFKFAEPCYTLLIEFSYPRPFRFTCESALDEDGEFCQEVGTGMWMIDSYESGQEVVLVPNPNYYGEKPNIDKVVLKQVVDGDARVMALQSGEADLNLQDIPSESFSIIQADKNLSTEQQVSTLSYYLIENYDTPALQDINVRQALNYATNKESIVNDLLDGYGNPATGLMSPTVPYVTEENSKGYPYDPDKAKELLKEAGYPDGFTTTLMYSNTTANQKKAEFYKQQLSEVGIDLELNGMESAVLNEKVQGADCAGADAEVECYLSGWSTSTGDADWGLRPMLATESEPPMSYNVSYYENEKVDQLLKDGLATADEDKRGEIYGEVQDIVWKDLPLLCIASDKNIWATSNNITGVYLLGDGSIGMRNARMAAE